MELELIELAVKLSPAIAIAGRRWKSWRRRGS